MIGPDWMWHLFPKCPDNWSFLGALILISIWGKNVSEETKGQERWVSQISQKETNPLFHLSGWNLPWNQGRIKCLIPLRGQISTGQYATVKQRHCDCNHMYLISLFTRLWNSTLEDSWASVGAVWNLSGLYTGFSRR